MTEPQAAPTPTSAEIVFLDNGQVRMDYDDQSHILMSSWGEGAEIIEQTTAEGDVFSGFNNEFDPPLPGHVEYAAGGYGDFAYPQGMNGPMYLKNSDLSEIVWDHPGEGNHILYSTVPNPDGGFDTYSEYDSQDRPHHVDFAVHS